jgi:ABC-type uncharacterized transport system involved in gliding motility auxiliary subunit
LVLYDRNEVEVAGGAFKRTPIETGLDPLLEKWGLRIPGDVLVADQNCQNISVQRPGPLGPTPTPVSYFYFPSISKVSGGLSNNHPITKNIQRTPLFFASPIDTTPDRPATVAIENLLQSSEMSFRTREVEFLAPDPDLGRRVGAKAVSQAPARERLGVALVGKFPSLYAGKPVPPPVESRPSHMPKPAVEDSKREVIPESNETRIVVIGDSDLATNDFITRVEGPALLLVNSVEWLALEQDLTSIRGRGQARRIRNLEMEAMRGKAKEETALNAANPADLQTKLVKFFEEKERVTLEARESAERTRFQIKLINILGPGIALCLFGFTRLWFRSRERARYESGQL